MGFKHLIPGCIRPIFSPFILLFPFDFLRIQEKPTSFLPLAHIQESPSFLLPTPHSLRRSLRHSALRRSATASSPVLLPHPSAPPPRATPTRPLGPLGQTRPSTFLPLAHLLSRPDTLGDRPLTLPGVHPCSNSLTPQLVTSHHFPHVQTLVQSLAFIAVTEVTSPKAATKVPH